MWPTDGSISYRCSRILGVKGLLEVPGAGNVVAGADFHDCIREVVDCNWAVVD